MKNYRATPYQNASLKASPGYFGLTLDSGVTAEMTTTQHTALYRFNFPTTSQGGSPLILLDLTDLANFRRDNSTVSVDPKNARISGNGRFLPSFGTGDYVLYFCVDFHGSPVRDGGIWVNSRGSTLVQNVTVSRGINQYPLPAGGFMRFTSSDPVLARVGLSFISTGQACEVAEEEIPSFDFESTQSAARQAWRSKISPITVSRNMMNSTMLRNFYSGIYRTMVNPQNYTGMQAVVSSNEIWFDSYYW